MVVGHYRITIIIIIIINYYWNYWNYSYREHFVKRANFASFVQSMMVAPRKFYLGQKSISNVNVKAAEFLTKKFGVLHDDPGQAVLLPRVCGQNYQTTKWQLPNLFASMVVTN